eukprot:2831465-Rhodomonas_salina.1
MHTRTVYLPDYPGTPADWRQFFPEKVPDHDVQKGRPLTRLCLLLRAHAVVPPAPSSPPGRLLGGKPSWWRRSIGPVFKFEGRAASTR